MKKIRMGMTLFAITLLMTVASSCKKDNSNVGCGSGLLCSTVDGVSYTGAPYNSSTSFFGLITTLNGCYAELIPSNTSTGGYYLKVHGNNGTANTNATWQIDFTVTQLPVAGSTYTTQAGSASFDYWAGSGSNKNEYVTDATHTGTVTISSVDTINNYISGTFSYTAYETGNYTPVEHTINSGNFPQLMIKR